MDESVHDKCRRLDVMLDSIGSAVVAFSGGTDSSFLLFKAHDRLVDGAVAVTVDTPFLPRHELEHAREFAERYGMRHVVIAADPLSDREISSNPYDRCYLCKTLVFRMIGEFAVEQGISAMLDGSNLDDADDFRPGQRALSELGIMSPLRDAGFTKDEIRLASKEMGLSTWDSPSSSCLATRFPYGERITTEGLARVERAERFLRSLGFTQLRVRDHGKVARIEVPIHDISRLADGGIHDKIVHELKRLGYIYIAADLEGYRSGSMNEAMQGG